MIIFKFDTLPEIVPMSLIEILERWEFEPNGDSSYWYKPPSGSKVEKIMLPVMAEDVLRRGAGLEQELEAKKGMLNSCLPKPMCCSRE